MEDYIKYLMFFILGYLVNRMYRGDGFIIGSDLCNRTHMTCGPKDSARYSASYSGSDTCYEACCRIGTHYVSCKDHALEMCQQGKKCSNSKECKCNNPTGASKNQCPCPTNVTTYCNNWDGTGSVSCKLGQTNCLYHTDRADKCLGHIYEGDQ